MPILRVSRPEARKVSQDEMLLWFGYRNQIAAMRRQLEDLERSIMQRLEAGGECEPGPHVAKIEERRTRGGKSFRLVVR